MHAGDRGDDGFSGQQVRMSCEYKENVRYNQMRSEEKRKRIHLLFPRIF